MPDVVYFNQHLGVAHSKQWSKSPFSVFFCTFSQDSDAEMKKRGKTQIILSPNASQHRCGKYECKCIFQPATKVRSNQTLLQIYSGFIELEGVGGGGG